MLKVKINHKGIHYSVGVNLNGKNVYVKNGDLIEVNEIECVKINEKDNLIVCEIQETFENKNKIIKIMDDDELIKTSFLRQNNKNTNYFYLDKKIVFPNNRIKGIIKYIINEPYLWENSKLKLEPNRSIYGRATMFGISFQQALSKLEKSGLQKARLYCDEKQKFTKEGVVAEMLANTYLNRSKEISIEIWQGVENVKEVFYAHGIMNREGKYFVHFDCAIIDFEINEKDELFRESKKIKSGNYQKMYRIDGIIEIEQINNLTNRFFPLDKLIDEYFKIEKV